MRALHIWTTILLSVPSAVQREIIAITDNTAVAGISARGRASVGNLNRLMRKVAAVVFYLGSKLFAPWLDTYHQPADGGTRAIEGVLQTGPVQWAPRDYGAMLGAGDRELEIAFISENMKIRNLTDVIINYHDRRTVRAHIRELESGNHAGVVINLGSTIWDDQQLGDLALGMRVAYSVGTYIIVWGPALHPGWGNEDLAFTMFHCTNVSHTVALRHYHRRQSISYRICTTRSQFGSDSSQTSLWEQVSNLNSAGPAGDGLNSSVDNSNREALGVGLTPRFASRLAHVLVSEINGLTLVQNSRRL